MGNDDLSARRGLGGKWETRSKVEDQTFDFAYRRMMTQISARGISLQNIES